MDFGKVTLPLAVGRNTNSVSARNNGMEFFWDWMVWITCVCSPAQSLSPLWTVVTPMDCSPPDSAVHGISQALEEIFLTEGLNPHLLHLLHWQADSLPLHHLGNHWSMWPPIEQMDSYLISSNPFSKSMGFRQETIIYILILSVFLLPCSWISLPRKHFRFNLKC